MFLGLIVIPLVGNAAVVALGFASLIVTVIALDGESNWFEGAQLLASYALVALAVWFI